MIHKVLFYVYVNNIEKSKARLERKIKAVMACPQVGTTPAQPTPGIILMPNPSNDAVVVSDNRSAGFAKAFTPSTSKALQERMKPKQATRRKQTFGLGL